MTNTLEPVASIANAAIPSLGQARELQTSSAILDVRSLLEPQPIQSPASSVSVENLKDKLQVSPDSGGSSQQPPEDAPRIRIVQIDGRSITLVRKTNEPGVVYEGDLGMQAVGENVSFKVSLDANGKIQVRGEQAIQVDGLGMVVLSPSYQNNSVQINAATNANIEGQTVQMGGYADKSNLLLTGATSVVAGGTTVPLTVNYSNSRGLSGYWGGEVWEMGRRSTLDVSYFPDSGITVQRHAS